MNTQTLFCSVKAFVGMELEACKAIKPSKLFVNLPAAACEFPVKFAVWMVALTPLRIRDAGALALRLTKLELTMVRA